MGIPRSNKSLLISSLILLAYMVIIFNLSIKPPSEQTQMFWQADKVVHAGVYGVMGLLALWVTCSYYKGNKGRATLYAFLISFFFGLFMEVAQSFVPLRDGSLYDCIANGVGAFIGVYIMANILGKVFVKR